MSRIAVAMASARHQVIRRGCGMKLNLQALKS
jgi:hypothetical protein